MPKLVPYLTPQRIDRAIRARKGVERVELADGYYPGLSLRIGPLGALWVLRIRSVNGARARIALGRYPAMPLGEARRAAEERREDARQAKPYQNPTTLQHIVDLYNEAVGIGIPSWPKAQKRIERVLAPLLSVEVTSITAPQLQKTVDAYPSKTMAKQCVLSGRPMLKWGEKRGHVTFDASKIEPPRITSVRERVLTLDELKKIIPVITLEGNAYTRAALLMMLTCCRRDEAGLATWGEFDLEAEGGAVWVIDPKRRKKGTPIEIPLPGKAVALLRRVKRVDGQVELFGRLNDWDAWQKRMFEKTGTSDWHRHDLRRTGATIMAGLGVAPHVIEAVLGHKHLGTQLGSVYNKNRYLPEHKDALEKLARHYYNLR